jgi:hypothetical protein
MLGEGVEIFKFGMSVDQVNSLLPYQIPGLTWDKLVKNPEYSGLDERFFGQSLRLFRTLKWMWIFRNEIPIFLRGPCISWQHEWVYFHFIAGSLFRISLRTADAPDCRSHKPLFEAVAAFFGVKTSVAKYGGIGTGITRQNGDFKVFRLDYGGPAENAGVLVGDVIKTIDDMDVERMILSDVSNKLRGAPGTAVVLDLYRPSDKKASRTKIVRSLLDLREDFRYNSDVVCLFGRREGGVSNVSIIKPGVTNGSADGCRHSLVSREAQR